MNRADHTRPHKSRDASPGLLTALLVVLLVALVAPAAQAAPKVHGVELMNWAKKVDEDRYKSPRDFEKTVKFFRDAYKGWRTIKRHRDVSLPGVKYLHFENLAKKREWDAINIYEVPGGHVYIYILAHHAPAAPPDDERKKPAVNQPPK